MPQVIVNKAQVKVNSFCTFKSRLSGLLPQAQKFTFWQENGKYLALIDGVKFESNSYTTKILVTWNKHKAIF